VNGKIHNKLGRLTTTYLFAGHSKWIVVPIHVEKYLSLSRCHVVYLLGDYMNLHLYLSTIDLIMQMCCCPVLFLYSLSKYIIPHSTSLHSLHYKMFQTFLSHHMVRNSSCHFLIYFIRLLFAFIIIKTYLLVALSVKDIFRILFMNRVSAASSLFCIVLDIAKVSI
jgi:hypothetical protein